MTAKRALDVVVASLGCLIALPIAISVAVAIRISTGSPVIFRQTRPGLGGEPFAVLKFRTMNNARTSDGTLLPDVERLTRVGRFLRRTSLDELPQLWNVLLGDMSLVGPRPLLMAYVERYSPQEARRHEVKPGVTGWAQVNGRNAISWEQKFALDVWYVDNRSFFLDLKILWITLLKVIHRRGVDASDNETMPEFLGSARGHARE